MIKNPLNLTSKTHGKQSIISKENSKRITNPYKKPFQIHPFYADLTCQKHALFVQNLTSKATGFFTKNEEKLHQ